MMAGNILTDRALPVPGLDYQDAILISRMARYVQRLDKQVNTNTKHHYCSVTLWLWLWLWFLVNNP